MENEIGGKKIEPDSSGPCTSLELQFLLLHTTVFWNLMGHEVCFKVFYILHKLFQRRVFCFHWSTCFHSGVSDFLHVTGDFSLCVYVYK